MAAVPVGHECVTHLHQADARQQLRQLLQQGGHLLLVRLRQRQLLAGALMQLPDHFQVRQLLHLRRLRGHGLLTGSQQVVGGLAHGGQDHARQVLREAAHDGGHLTHALRVTHAAATELVHHGVLREQKSSQGPSR